jgi:hypothetical protein
MNDTNRLMLAVGIALLLFGEYPGDWILAAAPFLIISMSSYVIRTSKDGIEHFRQMLEGEES